MSPDQADSKQTVIGYFVPEYPGQTHIFFWREMQQLRTLNVDPEVVSTRRPAKRIVSHSWAADEIKTTTYLFPPKPIDALAAAIFAIGCGPFAWFRCAQAVINAKDVSWKQRIRLSMMVLLGGQLARIAKQQGWEHIHVHSCADAANIAMFAKLLSGIPYSMTLHGPISDYGPNQRQKWKNSKFTIVITKKLHREAESQLAGALPASVPIAPMGVALQNFKRANSYSAWSGEGPLHVFACGRINACKGHEYLIQAIGLLRDREIDAHLRIAGAADSDNDSYLNLLKRTISELKLEDRVELLGAVSEEAVRTNIEEAHAFALASLHEPLGVVYMEAMAMECPTIATNGGGVTELITSGENGLLVDPKSSVQMADAIERVALDPEFARRVGACGRTTVEESFHSGISAETITRHIVDDFDDRQTRQNALVDEQNNERPNDDRVRATTASPSETVLR